jgi:hypothetical protein
MDDRKTTDDENHRPWRHGTDWFNPNSIGNK